MNALKTVFGAVCAALWLTSWDSADVAPQSPGERSNLRFLSGVLLASLTGVILFDKHHNIPQIVLILTLLIGAAYDTRCGLVPDILWAVGLFCAAIGALFFPAFRVDPRAIVSGGLVCVFLLAAKRMRGYGETGGADICAFLFTGALFSRTQMTAYLAVCGYLGVLASLFMVQNVRFVPIGLCAAITVVLSKI